MVMDSPTPSVLERVRASVQEMPARSGTRRVGFQAMGTWCEITLHAASRGAADRFIPAAIEWVAAFETKYSRFLPDSLISRINAAAGQEWVTTDPETDQLFGLCSELFFLTRRAFDPTALPLIRLWNWKAQPFVLPTDAAIQQARELTGWNKIQRRPGGIFLPKNGMCIDLGGVGKEYAVDRVVQLAAEFGVRDVLVNFGQDIHAAGTPPSLPAWHVGLEDPKKPGSCWGGVAARDLAVATSGDYLRKHEHNGRRYGHILDPRTGYPVDNGCRAVTVLAPTCTVAGILSTTAFILGPKDGLELISSYRGASGCILTETQRYETRQFAEHLTR